MAQHGTVSIIDNHGWLQLRIPKHRNVPEALRGKFVSLSLKATDANRTRADLTAQRMTLDIADNCFRLEQYALPEQAIKKETPITVATALESYINTKQCCEATKAIDRRWARRVVGVIRGTRELTDVTRQDVSAVKVAVRDLQPQRQRQVLNLCRAAWDVAGVVPNPWQGSTKGLPRQERKAPKPFTKQEESAIIAAFEAPQIRRGDGNLYPNPYVWYAPLVRFLLATGLRPGEARALRWEHVAPACSAITVTDSMGTGNKPKGKTKTQGSRRTLALNTEARGVLIAITAERTGIVFPSPDGGYIDQHNFCTRAWTVCLSVAGVEYRSPYNCRKTALTKWVSGGMPLNHVAALGGTSIAMLSTHYVGITDALILPD
jgi:integrase